MSGSWQRQNEDEASGRMPDGMEQRFDATSLVSLRSAVAAHGSALGLADGRVADLVLVAHELATNALKYGALSAPEGRVAVSWRVDGGQATISWRESGGPLVRAMPTQFEPRQP